MKSLDSNSDFKRFLCAAAMGFAIPFAPIWLWVIKEPMAYSDVNYPALLVKIRLAGEARPDNVPILGDSQPEVALIPRRLGPGVVNLAWAGRGSIEALHFARVEIRNPSPPKAVIISISPTHLMQPDLFWPYSVGSGLLRYGEVEEIRRRSALLNDATIFSDRSPGEIDTRLESFLYAIRFPSYFFPSLLEARGNQNYRSNTERYDQILRERGRAPVGPPAPATIPDREAALTSFSPSKILDDYFGQTLALCQAHQIPVYFLSMPHNEVSVRLYAPAMKREFTDYLAGYVRRYPNFHILGDLFLAYPPASFNDSSHLTEEASLRWSDDVAKMLNDARVPGGPFGPN